MARILKRSQRKMESTIDVPTESEYKAFSGFKVTSDYAEKWTSLF